MNFKELVLIVGLSLSSSCKSLDKTVGTCLDSSAVFSHDNSRLHTECDSVRERLNQIYLQIEPVYALKSCEFVGLRKSLDSTLRSIRFLQLNSYQCLKGLEPHEDLLDPYTDYMVRSVDFLTKLLANVETIAGLNIVDANQVDEYQMLFVYAQHCFEDLKWSFETYKVNGLVPNLDNEDFAELFQKIQKIDKLLRENKIILCSY